MHLFNVLAKVLSDLTNREPPNTPDAVRLKQLLECALVELSKAKSKTPSSRLHRSLPVG